MGCLKGNSENKAKPGRFLCAKCGAVSKKKKHLCKAEKIKPPKDGSSASH